MQYAFDKFGRILDETFNEIYLFDASTLKFLKVNFGAQENLQYSMDELEQMTPVDIKPRFTLEMFEEKVRPLREKTVPRLEFQTIHRRKDGTTYPVEVRLQLMHDETPPVFVAVIDDITARLRAEEELHFVNFALENAGDAAYWLEFDSARFVFVNQKACESLGYTRQELLQMSVFDIDPDYDAADWPDNKEKFREMGYLTFESRHRRKDGRIFPVEITTHFLSYGGKQYLIAFVRDISDAVEANKALHISEERLNLALESATDGLWDWNVQTGEVYFSPRWMTMLGYEPDELSHTFDTWEKLVHPEDIEPIKATLKKHLDGKIPLYQGEIRMKSKTGKWIWILTRGRVVQRDEAGNPLRAVGTHADITRLKETEARLKEATKSAEKANRAKTEFLSRMSHELRTPLNAILGFAQLLQMNASNKLDAEHQDGVQHILDGGKHLLELINEVLDLARIESGNLEIRILPVNPLALIRDTLKQLSPLSASLNIQVELEDRLEGQGLVMADTLRLKQVLINLISNAIKYNLPGGTVKIVIEGCQDNQVAIRVEDNGIGIPEDKLEAVFEPFDRLDNNGSNIEGTGIGLTITRRLVDMMSGTLEVTSVVGKGSCFSVLFPDGHTYLETTTENPVRNQAGS